MSDTPVTEAELRSAIERSGYYPRLVTDAVESTLGTEAALSYVVHHEATFDPDMEVARHLTVVVLSPTRLILCHTDDHPPSDGVSRPHATTTTEAVRLSRVHSVMLTRVVPDPASYVAGSQPAEVVLGVNWGSVSRLNVEPATCGDEACEADHGYAGAIAGDDLSLRVSEAADGTETVAQVVTFAHTLSEAATAPTTTTNVDG